ncbi:MAG: hypothetical protein ACRC7O_07500 [Fimbriiglobus sp.]
MIPDPRPTPPTDADTARELAAVEREPLLPIEKKLIAGSLLLGAGLLGVLLWATATFFPAK